MKRLLVFESVFENKSLCPENKNFSIDIVL